MPAARDHRARRRLGWCATVAAAAVLTGCTAGQSGGDRPGAGGIAHRSPAHERPGAATPTPGGTSQGTGGAATRPGQRSGHPVTLAFGGDVHFEGVDGVRLADDPSTAVGPIARVLRRADLAMVNLETAVTQGGTPTAGKQYVFRAPASAFRALRAAGVDVATMANNHGMDYGLVGLGDSLAAARHARFPVVGIGTNAARAFAPYRVTVRGQRLAFIGATQVIDSNLIEAWTAGPGKPGLASAKEIDRLTAAVRAARASADTVVVYLHYGQELASCPTADQQDVVARVIAAGADVVVGSHAHILLGGGWRGGAYVDYGLGNFVFYTGGGVTAHSGVLELTVAGRAVTRARWVPATIQGGVPVPLTGASAAAARREWRALRGCTGLAGRP